MTSNFGPSPQLIEGMRRRRNILLIPRGVREMDLSDVRYGFSVVLPVRHILSSLQPAYLTEREIMDGT